jgi:hypothetical protein
MKDIRVTPRAANRKHRIKIDASELRKLPENELMKLLTTTQAEVSALYLPRNFYGDNPAHLSNKANTRRGLQKNIARIKGEFRRREIQNAGIPEAIK